MAQAAVVGRRDERCRIEDLRADVGVLAVFGEARDRVERAASGPRRVAGEDAGDGRAERLAERDAVAHGRRHAVVREDHDIVAAARRRREPCAAAP